MQAIIKQLIYNIVFSLTVSVIVVVINATYTDFTFLNAVTSDDFWIVFILLLLGTFFKNKLAQKCFYALVLFLFLIEILHSIYYGNPILSAEIYKFFTDFTEITQGIGTNTLVMFIKPVFIIVILCILLNFTINKIQPLFFKISYSWLAPILALLILSYNASLEKGINRAQQLDQNLIRTAFETTGSFFGKYLPTKLFTKNFGGKIIPVPNKINPSNANIILIFGESLTYTHMSLFGYSKKTTPKLDSLYARHNFFKKKCIPAATCTEISILSFLNQLDTVAQHDQLFQGNHNLFKLAKQNKYQTYFLTSQSLNSSSSILGQINKQLIDHFSTPSTLNPKLNSTNYSLDSALLPQLKEALKGNQNKFIIMQMYGSHEQYSERYPSNFNKFNESTYKYPQTAHYDNSVLYTDYNLAKIFMYLKQNTTKPTYLFFVSDHGECVGEEDSFGHNMFNKQVLSVPFLYQTFNNKADTLCNWINNTKGYFNHNNISKAIAQLIGFNYTTKVNTFSYVNGLDIGGLDGFAKVQYNDSCILTIDLIK